MTAGPHGSDGPRWSLTLYVSGGSLHSIQAIETVRRICDHDLADHVELTVLDAFEHPDAVVRDKIVALPTLVKHFPQPRRHLVGDLTDEVRVRRGLDIGPTPPIAPLGRGGEEEAP